jgi:hypothetical protein
MSCKYENESPIFDIYAFADYSGAAKEALQKKSIAWCLYDRTLGNRSNILFPGVTAETLMHANVKTGLTRQVLVNEVLQLLRQATSEGKRVIFGFDHNYSFPIGLYEAVHKKSSPPWHELVSWLHDSLAQFSDVNGDILPRHWAAEINRHIVEQWSLPVGPFWGPHFTPLKRTFPYGLETQGPTPCTLHEYRLVERQTAGMKSFYQIGGAGSVGLQSLYGIYYLDEFMEQCRIEGICLHAWPYDGWGVPNEGHMLVEVYPTLYLKGNKQKRSDRGDAAACAAWIAQKDERGELTRLLSCPSLEEKDLQRVSLEGWILGL